METGGWARREVRPQQSARGRRVTASYEDRVLQAGPMADQVAGPQGRTSQACLRNSPFPRRAKQTLRQSVARRPAGCVHRLDHGARGTNVRLARSCTLNICSLLSIDCTSMKLVFKPTGAFLIAVEALSGFQRSSSCSDTGKTLAMGKAAAASFVDTAW